MDVYYDLVGNGKFYSLCFIATRWYQNWSLLELAWLMEFRCFAQISNSLGKTHCKQNTWKDMRKGSSWAIKTDFILFHGKKIMVLAFYSFPNYLITFPMLFHSINTKMFLLFGQITLSYQALKSWEGSVLKWSFSSLLLLPLPFILPFFFFFSCVCFQGGYRL